MKIKNPFKKSKDDVLTLKKGYVVLTEEMIKLKDKLKLVEERDLPIIKGKVKEVGKKDGLKRIDKLKLRWKPSSSFIINMQFSNGTSKMFVVVAKGETFMYRGRMYYLRYEDATFNLSHAQYVINFHEDFAVPIDREIHRKIDEKAEGEKQKAYWSVSSHNLKPLLKMEYVKALAEAQELTKFLKLGVLIGLANLLLLMFLAYQMYQIKPLI